MYGASEIATATSININKERGRIKSVGKSYNSKIKIRILSEKNKYLKMGEIGETPILQFSNPNSNVIRFVLNVF